MGYYLALGIVFETGVTNSMRLKTCNKYEVFKEMRENFNMEYDFDTIFLIDNDHDCPRIVEHWYTQLIKHQAFSLIHKPNGEKTMNHSLSIHKCTTGKFVIVNHNTQKSVFIADTVKECEDALKWYNRGFHPEFED